MRAISLPFFVATMLLRASFVPSVCTIVPSGSAMATPWCGAFVFAVCGSTVFEPTWSASSVWLVPAPSENSDTLPACGTTWPAFGAANVRSARPGSYV